MTTKQPWRQEIELLQNYSKHKSFTYTTTSADAETAVDVAANIIEQDGDSNIFLKRAVTASAPVLIESI